MYSQDKNFNLKYCNQLAIRFFLIIAISFSLIPSSVYAGPSNVKWQPGHYMRFKDSHSQNSMRTFLANQYTKGIDVQIAWKDLEPRINNYNFEAIDKFLDLVSDYNKFLMIDIEINCFNNKCTHGNSPGYLTTDPSYNGGVELMYRSNGEVKGSTARIWDPAVVNRIIKLLRTIGDKYDKHPNFVGVILPQESAIGFSKVPQGYTPSNYETQLRRIASGMASSMPRTMGIIGMNYFPRSPDLEATFTRLANHLVTTGQGGITHPDTFTENPNHIAHKVEAAFSDRLAIVAQFQTYIIRRETSEEDLHLFATKKLGAQFLVWNEHFTSNSGEQRPNYITDYVLPVVNKYKGKIAGNFPESYINSTIPIPAPKLSIAISD